MSAKFTGLRAGLRAGLRPRRRLGSPPGDPSDLHELKERLMPPSEREAFLSQYGQLVAPILEELLEAKAKELVARYAATLAGILDRTDGTIPRDRLLCTREEAGEMLGVSLSTIKRMEQSGELPEPVRFGERQVRHRLVDVERIACHQGSQIVPIEG